MDKREKNRVENVLRQELNRLKKQFNTGHHLDLLYVPTQTKTGARGNTIMGEIQNGTILIYEVDFEEAIHTLQHEFMEYILKRRIEPYVLIINKQKEIIERILYLQEEETVEVMVRGI